MTDQQPRAPHCPKHGSMVWTDNISAGEIIGLPIPPGWWCHADGCYEYGTPALLEHEYQRGFEDGCEASAQADHAHAVEDTEHARGLYYWKLRAEEAEARERDHFDRMRAINIQLKERTEERDRLREEVRLAKYSLTGIAEDRSTDPSARARITLRYMRESGDCPRCGNPQSDCQCYGSAAMSEDRLKHDVQEAQENLAGWSSNKQDAMLSEANNVRSGSAAMEHERAANKALRGRCWCGREVFSNGSICQKGHQPCPGCKQWVEWDRHGPHYIHIQGEHPGGAYEPCPGPAPHGYCHVHPNTPLERSSHNDCDDQSHTFITCPRCSEEKLRDAN